MNNPRIRNFVIYATVFAALLLIVFTVRSQSVPATDYSLSEVAKAINDGKITKIVINGDNLELTFADETSGTARKSPEDTAQSQLAELGANVREINWEIKEPSNWGEIFAIITYILPIVMVVGVIYFVLRQAQGSNNQALSFGKSRARMFNSDQPTVTFDDVAGLPESKEELREVVEFLKEPDKFNQLGARIPKGVLLIGPPGTGKTLLAKAVSGEAGVPFFSISGSEFVEMFVGVGASRVRDLFEQAKRHSPCIIFIDEIDAVGRQRGAGLGGSHDEREQTLNQILVEMDGFDSDVNIIIIAATNRPDILDPALLRPGRFDRTVVIDRPDVRGREQIIGVHVRGKPLDKDVDPLRLAKATPGFSGADIENMVNEAAILAARHNRKSILMQDFENAIERVQLGPERKSRVITERQKRVVAYHEAGHAVVARSLPDSDVVRKVTIIPRGMAGGVTWFLPDEETSGLMTRKYLKTNLAIALGGRVAEELVMSDDDITTGASGDLQKVTQIARQMVMQWGMSDLGPIAYGRKEELVFLGREIGEQRDFSESVAEKIDREVNQLVTEAHETARRLLKEHQAQLESVAQALLEFETLDLEEFEQIWNGQVLPPRPIPESRPTPSSGGVGKGSPTVTKPGTIPVASGA